MSDSTGRDRLLNYALYQLGWFACVLGAARGQGEWGAAVGLALLGAHLALADDRRAEILLALACGAAGWALDSLQAATGRLLFADAPSPVVAPPWVVVLWLQLATTLRYCLVWLAERPGLAAALGALGGPLAFLGGERLGAAAWGEPRALTALSLALAWGVATPLLLALARRLGRGESGGYRWPRATSAGG